MTAKRKIYNYISHAPRDEAGRDFTLQHSNQVLPKEVWGGLTMMFQITANCNLKRRIMQNRAFTHKSNY